MISRQYQNIKRTLVNDGITFEYAVRNVMLTIACILGGLLTAWCFVQLFHSADCSVLTWLFPIAVVFGALVAFGSERLARIVLLGSSTETKHQN